MGERGRGEEMIGIIQHLVPWFPLRNIRIRSNPFEIHTRVSWQIKSLWKHINWKSKCYTWKFSMISAIWIPLRDSLASSAAVWNEKPMLTFCKHLLQKYSSLSHSQVYFNIVLSSSAKWTEKQMSSKASCILCPEIIKNCKKYENEYPNSKNKRRNNIKEINNIIHYFVLNNQLSKSQSYHLSLSITLFILYLLVNLEFIHLSKTYLLHIQEAI